jgi:hypothetical protein
MRPGVIKGSSHGNRCVETLAKAAGGASSGLRQVRQEAFGSDRQGPMAGGVVGGAGDRGRGTDLADPADALDAERAGAGQS